MAITVDVRVNRAKWYGSGWSVAYGGGADFLYERGFTCKTFEELHAHLKEIAERLVSDSRISNWPGYWVCADRVGSRKPNGWDKNHANRRFCVAVADSPTE